MTSLPGYPLPLTAEEVAIGFSGQGEDEFQVPTVLCDDQTWIHLDPGQFVRSVRDHQMKGQVVGKLILSCRCEGYTTTVERINIALALQNLFEVHLRIRPEAKFAKSPDHNLVPMLYYCGDQEFEGMEAFLKKHGADAVGEEYTIATAGNPYRALTLTCRFKSDAQTMGEVSRGTHYSQKNWVMFKPDEPDHDEHDESDQ